MEYDTGREIRLAGIGMVDGGKADRTTIDGMGKVTGDLDSGKVIVNGQATFKGSVRAASADINGLAGIDGGLRADKCRVEGKLTVEESLEAEEATVNGSLTVHGPCRIGRLLSHGKLQLDALSGDEARLELRGTSSIRELSARFIQASAPSDGLQGWQKLLPLPVVQNRLMAHTIEGEDIFLEHVTASLVRGARVRIGAGCDIGRVEYAERLERHADARVGSEARLA
ncbi:polymer-forming cytoskeletal protein [Paenibacillus pasadenensis]|uniref:polymer-forming cytoskeletal protein n=1 Tax=Paenibacillus pasadenensis TaxID=217090 RepID=UPI0004046745|nr:polymer-forming cytoskeletal protein [Paenibacillus pasadenensis]